MTPKYNIPFWALSKQAQKHMLEFEIRQLLSDKPRELSVWEKYFLHETLCHIFAGRYELACESMDDIYEPDKFSAAYNSEISKSAKSITYTVLARALRCIEGIPTREYPVFR